MPTHSPEPRIACPICRQQICVMPNGRLRPHGPRHPFSRCQGSSALVEAKG